MNIEKIINLRKELREQDFDRLERLTYQFREALQHGNDNLVRVVPYVSHEKELRIPTMDELFKQYKNKKNMNYFIAPDRTKALSIGLLLEGEKKNSKPQPTGFVYWADQTKQMYFRAENVNDKNEPYVHDFFKSLKSAPRNLLAKRPQLIPYSSKAKGF